VEVNCAAAQVARAIAQLPEVPFVSIVTGPRAVAAEIRTASTDAFIEAVDTIRALPGVESATTLTYTNVVRDVVGPVGEISTELDSVDLALLRHLQDDGRASYVDLAERVGLSAAGVRRRVRTLIEHKVVRVGAVVRHSGHDQHVAMGVGIRLTGARQDVVDGLRGLDSMIFMAHTTGEADILLTLRAFSAAQLAATADRIRGLAGVSDINTWIHLSILKEGYDAKLLDEILETRGVTPSSRR